MIVLCITTLVLHYVKADFHHFHLKGSLLVCWI